LYNIKICTITQSNHLPTDCMNPCNTIWIAESDQSLARSENIRYR
jgi:hypothetical protein